MVWYNDSCPDLFVFIITRNIVALLLSAVFFLCMSSLSPTVSLCPSQLKRPISSCISARSFYISPSIFNSHAIVIFLSLQLFFLSAVLSYVLPDFIWPVWDLQSWLMVWVILGSRRHLSSISAASFFPFFSSCIPLFFLHPLRWCLPSNWLFKKMHIMPG